jgi:hypothetical protein
MPLGWVGASGGVSASTFELIQTQVLASTATSVVFNISAAQQAAYKHLQLRIVTRAQDAVGIGNGGIRFNSDTGNNYSWHQLLGDGSTATSGATPTTSFIGQLDQGASVTASSFAVNVTDILDAFNTSKNKTTRTLAGAANASGGNLVRLSSGAWYNTAAISSITFIASTATNIVVGSRFSLYGVQ